MVGEMRKTIKTFKAVSDRSRLRIIKMLQQKNGLCVCEIKNVLGAGQSTTSRHLRILEEADLIYSERDGKWINYFINQKDSDRYIKNMLKMLDEWLNDDRQIHADLKKLKFIDRNLICHSE